MLHAKFIFGLSIHLALVSLFGLSAVGDEVTLPGRWSVEKAGTWYDEQPWLVGCNFTPSTAINQLEMWQADTFDPETIDRELGWAAGIGMNTVRVYLHDLVWEQDSEGFLKRIDQFLGIADKHGISTMLVLCDAVWDPHPKLGKQPEPRPHVHNSGWVQSPHIEVLRDLKRHDSLEPYFKGVIGRFKDDPRVIVWDLYNEPGNDGERDQMTTEVKEKKGLHLLKKMFAWAREINPSQPLTTGLWSKTWVGSNATELNRFIGENSDIITFHVYEPIEKTVERFRSLRPFGRPVLCTEYLSRPKSTFEDHLPYFKFHKIGAYNWGLVAGKIETQYPWASWRRKFTAPPNPWFHDVLNPDGTPHRPAEAALIKELTAKDPWTISLRGTWGFKLDPDDQGVEKKWYSTTLDDTIRLPGTTDENKKGILKEERRVDRLSRVWYWKGPAWYQRRVNIPEHWRGRHVVLSLERTKNTRVWVDGKFIGWEDTLSAPQVFDVTEQMTPGEHVITVVVDNAKMPPVGPSHAVDERTQTNWNGLVGKLELRASKPIWIEDVQVYPNAARKEARVRVVIGNNSTKGYVGSMDVTCKSANVSEPKTFASQNVKVRALERETVVEFTYKPGEDVPLWDEFQPALLDLTLSLGPVAMNAQRTVRFGMRDLRTFRNRLLVNDRPVFLRGKLDCCFFPLTGYPPMTKAGWKRVLGIAKSYGVNHYRFHSWCPPKAAFEAADELGFYFQPELPNKRSGFKAPESEEAAQHNIDRLDVATTETKVSLYDFGKRESALIFKHYGNHPSFVTYTLGNELGRNPAMHELVAHFKEIDPRHLYAQASNQMHWNPSLAEGDEFWVGTALKNANGTPLPLRAAYWAGDWVKGHLEHEPPSTTVDYSESIAGVPVPVIVHENASFEVYPDYREIPRYTGVTRAWNLEIPRQRLKEAGMLDQAHDFLRASGALSVICHREDIESSLRTPGLGGFQLLDIQDFSGQGTALVGILNVFMESKGLIRPFKWRRFCSETVPLVRMKKYTWTTDETFHGRVQVAHYGPADLPDARVTWNVTGANGKEVASGAFDRMTIKQGNVREVDLFSLPLGGIEAPQKLNLTLAIEGTRYRNDYPIWLYPPKADTAVPEGVMIADDYTAAKTQAHLAGGGKVLLLPKLDQLPHSIEGAFMTGFWSPMFAASAKKRGIKPPACTEGLLCDPKSPALAAFPTEFHSNWQWWHLVKNSRSVILDDTPDGYRPIVQVIDNFVRSHKLGLIFETKVGSGKLLVCGIDLLGHQDKPEARQLLYSLVRYAGSKAFAPSEEIDADLLKKLLPGGE